MANEDEDDDKNGTLIRDAAPASLDFPTKSIGRGNWRKGKGRRKPSPDDDFLPPRHFTETDFIPVPVGDIVRLVRAIESGLPIAAMERFQQQSGLPMARVAKLIRIPTRTLARRREEGVLTAEESDRLVRVSRLFAAAANLFGGDVASGVEWLSKPLLALGGIIPLDIAETEAGSHEVERVIRQLEHGVFI